MKIGILTFHDEINYGSLLQAYAMQTELLNLGHEVWIIDRWYESDQHRIYGILHCRSFAELVRWCISCVLGLGAISRTLREMRSRRFIRTNFKLTPFHFTKWSEAPKDIGFDIITVGSDQVWHPGNAPEIYLLKGVGSVKKIAYSASLSVHRLPEDLKPLYRCCLADFSAIGVREFEAVRILEDLGIKATHVVDPTLLVNPVVYDKILPSQFKSDVDIVGYFLLENMVELLRQFGRRTQGLGIKVRVFVQDAQLPMPTSIRKLKKILLTWYCRLRYPWVKVIASAPPGVFIANIKTADCVITNSFHALMFSVIYKRNVRVVMPTSSIRSGMSARMQEFADDLIKGHVLFNSIESALNSYLSGESIIYDKVEIDRRVAESENWLRHVISM